MISAEIIADSINQNGNRITTFECVYPRFIHSELMTHRLFSRNAASSRAIPTDKMLKLIEDSPAMPVEWGKEQSGMQAKEAFTEEYQIGTCIYAWKQAAKSAVDHAKGLQKLGLHKQIVNRIVEPFTLMKTVITATEFNNFFWLRCHPDAQPEIKVLAEIMENLYDESFPVPLSTGHWHMPYYLDGYWHPDSERPLEDALKISASCCAQVSFRTNDDGIDKAKRIYERLVESTPIHASPFEHQATPIDVNVSEDGITSIDRYGKMWSGNFKGWVQHRQLIEGHTKW